MKPIYFLKYEEQFKDPKRPFNFNIWTEARSLPHNHNFFEVFIVLEGQVKHYINDKKEVLNKGDFRFIRPNDVHYQYAMKGNGKTKTANIAFKREVLSDIVPLSNTANSLTEGESTPVSTLDGVEFDFVENLIAQVIHYENDSSLSLILLTLFNRMELRPQNEAKAPEKFIQFKRELEKQTNFTTTISELCKTSGYSQSMLTKLFKKYYGKTLVEYFLDNKMKYACNMLTSTNFTTLSIANDVGFYSLSSFNRIFKKKLGVSPSLYRKQNKRTTLVT